MYFNNGRWYLPKLYFFVLIWSSEEILKNTQDVNGVQIKMSTLSSLTPLTECRFITKFCVSIKNLLFLHNTSERRLKTIKRTTKKHSRLKNTTQQLKKELRQSSMKCNRLNRKLYKNSSRFG
jgi:hypothetical protein